MAFFFQDGNNNKKVFLDKDLFNIYLLILININSVYNKTINFLDASFLMNCIENNKCIKGWEILILFKTYSKEILLHFSHLIIHFLNAFLYQVGFHEFFFQAY